MVTEEDRRNLNYFYFEKDDITRWAYWDERKADFREEYPELIAAMDNLVIAQRTLTAVVEKIIGE